MSPWFQQAVVRQRDASVLTESETSLFLHWPEHDGARVCAIVAHTLRHRGEPAGIWQPWLALAAAGHRELEDFGLARALSLLARVHADLADRLPAGEPRRVDHRALNHVLGLGAAPSVPDAGRWRMIEQGFDSLNEDEGYGLLAEAIVARDWTACRLAFERLAGFALEGLAATDWNAEFRPGYEPATAALAAVARDAGFSLESLASAAREWVWPAVESVPGITPVLWPPAPA